MPATLECSPDLRAGSVLRSPAGSAAGALPRLLSLAATVVLWFIVADCLVASLGYLASKNGSSLGSIAAYAAGHLIGGGLLLAVWRSHSLRRRLGLAFDKIVPHLSQLRGVLLFVGAITVLRLAWVLFVPTQPTSDHAVYHGLAVRLAETGVYDTEKHRAYWPPGYPAFLAALYAVFGPAVLIGKLGNVVLAGLADLLTWRVVRAHVGATAAVAALLLTAAWPGRNFHVDVLSYDELVIVLLLASLTLLPGQKRCQEPFSAQRPGGCFAQKVPDTFFAALRWIAAGFVLGLACLVRPTLGVTPVAVVGWLLVGRCSWRRAVLCTALYTAAMLVPIVPWTVRNYVVLGRFVPLTTNAGGNFYNSWAPGGTGGFYKPGWEHLHAVTGGDELKLSPTGFALGLAAIREDPARAAWRAWQKQVHYLGSDNWLLPVESYSAALGGDTTRGALAKTALHTATNGWYVLLMLWPLVGKKVSGTFCAQHPPGRPGKRFLTPFSPRCFQERPLAWLCLSLFALGLIIHTVFESQARYHLVYLPFWGLMLGVLLVRTDSRSEASPCR